MQYAHDIIPFSWPDCQNRSLRGRCCRRRHSSWYSAQWSPNSEQRSARIWDLLNTNVIKTLDTEDCTIAKAHRVRGRCWWFLKNPVNAYSPSCEKRFTELRKRQRQRKRMHYIDMMARQFNQDLLADQQQLCLIPHDFSDEERLAELVQTLLRDLGTTSTSFVTMSWCYLTQWISVNKYPCRYGHSLPGHCPRKRARLVYVH